MTADSAAGSLRRLRPDARLSRDDGDGIARTGMMSLEQGTSSGEQRLRRRDGLRLWSWTLRLVLPVLILLADLALYWLWTDLSAGARGYALAEGLPLAVAATALLLWAIGAWMAPDPP